MNIRAFAFAAFELAAIGATAAKEIVFKPGDIGSSYLYANFNESSRSAWWVDGEYLGKNSGADVTFWGEQDKSVYSNVLKYVTVHWPNDMGTVKGDNTWYCEFRYPGGGTPTSFTIGNGADFYGWWRFLRPFDVKFTSANSTFTPVLQRVESGGRAILNVPDADGKLIVSNLFGSGVVQKSGSGEMEVVRSGGSFVNIEHHAGTLTLHEQEKGDESTFETILARAKVHFDASDKTKFTFDSDGTISRWNASAPNTQYYARTVYTNKFSNMGAPEFTNRYKSERLPQPVYRDNYSATGLGAVDFGPYRKYDAADVDTCGASALEFMYSGARVNFSEAFIVFADNDPQCRCCVFCDSHNQPFPRNTSYEYFDNNNIINYNGGIVSTKGASVRNARDVRVNGRLVPAGFALAGRNLKVVSIDCVKKGNVQASESVMGSFGRPTSSTIGGQVVAEFIAFAVSLTDAERQTVNRHLMKKWLGADDCDEATVNQLKVDAGAVVKVPAGETALVNHIVKTNNSPLVKTGAGTLAFTDLVAADGIAVDISVSEGAIAVKAPTSPIPTVPTAADTPRYHFDASALDTLTTNLTDGVTYVTRWDDVSQDGVYAYPITTEVTLKATTNDPPVATAPAKPQLESNACNGLPVIWLGNRTDSNVIVKNGYGSAAAMLYSKSAEDAATSSSVFGNVMEGFAVIKGSYCVYPFSCMLQDPFYPSGYNLISERYGMAGVKGGLWTINGEDVNPGVISLDTAKYGGKALTSQYFVLRFSSNERVQVDGIGFERIDPNGFGGLRVGEVVLYDRRLNETERRNTEAYLMKKWLNLDHPYANGPKISSVTFAAASDSRIETDSDVTVPVVTTASSTFTKAGTGILRTNLPAGVDTLNVEAGTFAITPAASNTMAKALVHLDASVSDSLKYDEDDAAKIVRWNDVRGSSRPCALRDATRYSGYPTLKANALNGKPVVDLGDTSTTIATYDVFPMEGAKALCFDRTLLVREGFLVMCHNGRSPILGSWDNCNFHPDETYIINVNPTTDHSLSCLKRETEWHVDDTEIDIWTYKWSTFNGTGSGYHVLSFSITNAFATASAGVNCATVKNLSADRSQCAGGEKFGEVILFDTPLQPEQRAALRAYLARKWGTADVASADEHSLGTLNLGAGATVDLGSVTSVGNIAGAGAGAVSGNLTLSENATIAATWRGASDCTQTAVSGTLALPAAASCVMTIAADSKPAVDSHADIFTAAAITGSCAGWQVVTLKDADGQPYGSRAATLSVVTLEDGKQALRATFAGVGMMLIVR